jgi:hypothetical protein
MIHCSFIPDVVVSGLRQNGVWQSSHRVRLFRPVVVEESLNSASIASARYSNGRMSAASLGPAHWWHVFFVQSTVGNAVKTALYSRQFYTESITLAHHINLCLYL